MYFSAFLFRFSKRGRRRTVFLFHAARKVFFIGKTGGKSSFLDGYLFFGKKRCRKTQPLFQQILLRRKAKASAKGTPERGFAEASGTAKVAKPKRSVLKVVFQIGKTVCQPGIRVRSCKRGKVAEQGVDVGFQAEDVLVLLPIVQKLLEFFV